MYPEVIILPIMFGLIFGVFYLFFSTRNKERLALIEKGVDASIFMRGRPPHAAPLWKIFIANLSLLLMGIGIGIYLAAFLHYNLGVEPDVAYPGTIFLMAGIGLFIGFNLTKKLDQGE